MASEANRKGIKPPMKRPAITHASLRSKVVERPSSESPCV